MDKKSILYIITKSVWGGAGKYVYDLSVNMSADFEVAVAGGGRGALAQRLEDKIPYFEIKHFQRDINLFKEPLACLETLRLLFKLKPDIVHVNSSKAGGTVGLAVLVYRLFTFRQIKTIFTAHGWVFVEDRPKITIAVIKFLSKITALFYDKIICVSEYDRQTAINNNIAPSKKLITIHNGIDIKNLNFLPKEEARKKLLNAPSISKPVIGTIAEWHRNKGLFYLLEALKKTDSPLILIGGGENKDKEKIYQYIKENNLKNIYLHEFIPNVASYLKAFDIFVLPSIKEGLPYTILEAMFAETSVIATTVGGIPEIIDNNINGFLVEPKNSQQLAEKINYLINNPEIGKMITRKSKEKIVKEFSLEKMIQETKRIYL